MTTRQTVGRLLLLGVVPCLLWPAPASPESPAPSAVSCKTPDGRTVISQAPSKECSGSDQVVHGPTGETVRTIPRPLTPEEQRTRDGEELARIKAEESHKEAVRVDQQLRSRYRDRAAHDKARARALVPAQDAITASERRLAQLTEDRKPLDDETQFYVGKPLPASLKGKIDANQTAVDAQRVLLLGQRQELARINANFDLELERLTRLWNGAPPGSLGPLTTAPSPK